MPPKLAARVRVLSSGKVNKNDPNDARAVAVAALRSPEVKSAAAEDHALVLRVWEKRNNDLGRLSNKAACRLHSVLCDLVAGGIATEISADAAERLLENLAPANALEATKVELAAELIADVHHATTPRPAHAEPAIPPDPRRSPQEVLDTERTRSKRMRFGARATDADEAIWPRAPWAGTVRHRRWLDPAGDPVRARLPAAQRRRPRRIASVRFTKSPDVTTGVPRHGDIETRSWSSLTINTEPLDAAHSRILLSS